VLLVLGHGRSGGLCHHLAGVVRDELGRLGAEVREHDLLGDGFDPVLLLRPGQSKAEAVDPAEDPLVARYQADVRWADAYVIVHPVWWFAPPAILKGWIDRVLADSVALDHSHEPPQGLLGGRRALVVSTFKAGRTVDRLLMHRISSRFWKNAVFLSVGIREVTPLGLYEVGDLSERRLQRFGRRLRQATARLAVLSGRARDRSR
jgi:putative NADPH-quinone reductase